MSAPQFLGPDGVYRDILTFSTTKASRFFHGRIDPDTADMEISIRGSGFTTDPDFITFEGDMFTVPNPSVFPEGLELAAGRNDIAVRSVLTQGTTTTSGVAEVTLVQEGDVGFLAVPPTNVSLEKLDGRVQVTIEGLTDPRVVGYNFFASRFPSGGVSGFAQLNINAVIDGKLSEEVQQLAVLDVDSDVALDFGGNPAADPLFVNVLGNQVDEDGVILSSDYNELFEIPETTTRLRTEVTISSVREVTFVSFEHVRTANERSEFPTIPNGDFAATSIEDDLYYVVTALYFDQELNLELESSQSVEVAGRPLVVTAVLGSYPEVSRRTLVQNITAAILRPEPTLKVEAGSVLRDTVIDPVSSDLERLYFISDYTHRAQAFPTLLEVDDPTGTGQSIAVTNSSYKQALKQAFFLVSDSDVQTLLDQAFDSLASRMGKTRRVGQRSRGKVTFFTTRRPTQTLVIPIGTGISSGNTVFRTTEFAQIPFDQLASFFNPITKQYSVTVSVQADDAGSIGNVAQGQLRQIVSGPTGLSLSVTNENRTFGGFDNESNLELATRAQNALAGVDTGTRRGYLQTVAEVPGVVQTRVIEAGDPLMQRDFDVVTGEHRGGKVDIWIQGTQEGIVSDVFAFTFETARDIQFQLIGLPEELVFRAVDPTLTLTNPILEMLDFLDLGLGLRNATTGEYYDLTDVEITSFDTIVLSQEVPQPPITLTDVVLGDYRFRTGTEFALTRQPVREVRSVTGDLAGELDPDIYFLVRQHSPLQEGRSTQAGNFLQIVDPGDGTGPSGDTLPVTDEDHVLVGEYPEAVNNLGANSLTLQVFSEDKTTEYKGPQDPSGIPDYTIIEGDQTTPIAVKRVVGAGIPDGSTVLFDYDHDENFQVTYVINQIVQAAQDTVANTRHLTADVVVKDAIEVPVNITATVVLTVGETPSRVDTFIRTDLGNFIEALRLGEPLRLSDAIGVIERVQGVSYIIISSFQMFRAEGAQVVREVLSTGQPADTTLVSAWSTETVNVWLIDEPLEAATTTGGGPENEFQGVFKDDYTTQLELVRPDLLGEGADRSYIIGSDGLIIPGVSDDTTIRTEGFVTDAEIEGRRLELTADRVLVSIAVGDSPSIFEYTVTYIVGEDSGPKNIDPGPSEYLTLGDAQFTFDEDRR